ncbi:MAG: hypothetical protein MK135_14820 [Polyangiaceae bacterium]|nr:hypothetical protein [Polyangiaceae bacterium]
MTSKRTIFSSMLRWLSAGLWVWLMLALFCFSPEEHPQLGEFLWDLVLFQGEPLEVALFQAMGILPLAFTWLLWSERGRPPAWPFLLGSFALGGFILLPYLVLQPARVATRSRRSSQAGYLLLAASGALLVYGLFRGDWGAFQRDFASIKFIYVMSFDFAALMMAFPFTWWSRRQVV